MTERTEDLVKDLVANVEEEYPTFESMNLKEQLLRGVYGYDFHQPSAIQRKAIVPIIKGRDTIVQAQSGTGKTGAFSIGLLQRLQPRTNRPQALVISPTRELARQSHSVVSQIAQYMGIHVILSSGGEMTGDYRSIREGRADVIVATPGRAKQLLEELRFGVYLTMIVLDEADRMLDDKFAPLVTEILQATNREIQIVLVSATMTEHTLSLSKHFMRDPACILVKADELSLEGIRQFFVDCEDEMDKLHILDELYRHMNIQGTIIFCNTKRRVAQLAQDLENKGHTVSQIHGDMEQAERNSIMQQFREASTRVLVTTDLLARGIDVQHVSLVINYELPQEVATYLHRIGRSGRYGRKGVAINLLTPMDYDHMEEISRFYGTTIDALPEDISNLI